MDGWMDDREKINGRGKILDDWGKEKTGLTGGKFLDDWGEKLAKRAPYIDKNEGFWLQGEHNFPAKLICT